MTCPRTPPPPPSSGGTPLLFQCSQREVWKGPLSDKYDSPLEEAGYKPTLRYQLAPRVHYKRRCCTKTSPLEEAGYKPTLRYQLAPRVHYKRRCCNKTSPLEEAGYKPTLRYQLAPRVHYKRRCCNKTPPLEEAGYKPTLRYQPLGYIIKDVVVTRPLPSKGWLQAYLEIPASL